MLLSITGAPADNDDHSDGESTLVMPILTMLMMLTAATSHMIFIKDLETQHQRQNQHHHHHL